jgi:uncharacterized protein YehS (DUF1456 family)
MTNNDVLRRIRYTFKFNDKKMVAIFALAGVSVEQSQVTQWLKKDEDPEYQNCGDAMLAAFLNGFITEKRGKKEGVPVKAEKRINNNVIFMKLKIALSLQADGVLKLMSLAGLDISKHELSAFFRRPEHKHYRECKDQILRNFLKGVQIKYRDNLETKPATEETASDSGASLYKTK